MNSRATAERKSPSKKQKRSKSAQSTQRPWSPKKKPLDFDTTSEPDLNPRATLYDAVAGRVNRDGFILSSNQKPAPPDQILFSGKQAPIRYEETDTYFAHRRLAPGVKLPDSELLKAVHAYVSDFYGSGAVGNCDLDWGSMDETALMAVGILLEEAIGVKLGKTGDLAFVEEEKKIPVKKSEEEE